MTLTAKVPAEIKGALLSKMIEFCSVRLGRNNLLEHLMINDKAFYQLVKDKQVFDSSWYSVTRANTLISFCCPTGRAIESQSRELGRYCICELLTGVHKVFIRAVSPQAIIRYGSKFFGMYYRGGRVDVLRLEATSATYVLADFNGLSAGLWFAVFAGSETVLEGAGGKKVRVHGTRKSNLSQDMLVEAVWS